MAPLVVSSQESPPSSDSIHEDDPPCATSSPIKLQDSEWLKQRVPDSTMEERYRFLTARNGDQQAALTTLKHYVEWRQQYESVQQSLALQHLPPEAANDVLLNDDLADEYDWLVASQTAIEAQELSNINQPPPKLPRLIRMSHSATDDRVRDLDGKRILHFIPGQMDDSDCSMSTYALAIALYMDRRLARDSTEKITVLLDVRAGEGWRNIPAYKMIPFIKDIVQLLLALHPERLHKCILFSVPTALSWIFSAVKRVMDPLTAQKMYVLSGSASVDGELPLDQIQEHMQPNVALLCEDNRLQAFVC